MYHLLLALQVAAVAALEAATLQTLKEDMNLDDDMAASRAADGTVGATTTGRIGFRYEK